MVGVIQKRHILAHPFLTIRCFGVVLFFRALWAGPGVTFLSLLKQERSPTTRAATALEILDRCAAAERQSQRIYETLATRFKNQPEVRSFLEQLAREEEQHGEMVELCRQIAADQEWPAESLARWRKAIPVVERDLAQARASVKRINSVAEAMRLVMRVESSEINRIFSNVVTITPSPFVAHLGAFQQATVGHLGFIAKRIAELEPTLADDCRRLRDQAA